VRFLQRLKNLWKVTTLQPRAATTGHQTVLVQLLGWSLEHSILLIWSFFFFGSFLIHLTVNLQHHSQNPFTLRVHLCLQRDIHLYCFHYPQSEGFRVVYPSTAPEMTLRVGQLLIDCKLAQVRRGRKRSTKNCTGQSKYFDTLFYSITEQIVVLHVLQSRPKLEV